MKTKKMKRTISVLLTSCLLFGATGQMAFAKDGGEHGQQGQSGNQGGHTRLELDFSFKDIDDASWAEAYIKKMKWKKIFQGYEDGTFHPNESITQAEAIITAVKLMGLEAEAKAKPADAELLFKDADLIDKNYSWAKGYILVALEHGLFESTEDRIDPGKPASRVWVASLLVKSLGLEAEALTQMSKEPNFEDAEQIPAGAVGYVNVALAHNLISGYPNGTFLPNRPVTRAEMATLLDRTNDGIEEQDGAVKVSGTISEIHFTTGDASTVNGQVTVQTFGGGTATYGISSGMVVQNGTQFISALDLKAGSVVNFTVKDNNVTEAALVSAPVDALAGILKFSAEFDLANDQQLEWRYSNRNGVLQAQVVDQTTLSRGDEAVAKMKPLLTQMNLTSTMSKDEVLSKVQSVLNQSQYVKAAIEVQFANGKTIEIIRDNGQVETPGQHASLGVNQLEIKAELPGKDKYALHYKLNDGKAEAEVRIDYKKNQQKLTGKAAVDYVERVLEKAAVTDKMSGEEIAVKILSNLNIKKEHLKKVELEIEFASNKQLKFENASDDDHGQHGDHDED